MKIFTKMITLFATIVIGINYSVIAQVGINIDGAVPDGSAMLDVVSTDKGFLPPRLSTMEMNAISSPSAGLMVYNTSINSICFYDGTSWRKVYDNDGESCGTITYDGQTYQTVIVGTQCWMAENLNIGTRIDGANNQTDNSTIEKYCYNNSTSHCDTYGGLYQWDEMMQYVTTEGVQGICPTGWHLPTDAEWMILEEEAESTTGVNWNTIGDRGTDAGGNLKETGTTHWGSPNTDASNSIGFTGLPGGLRLTGEIFDDLTFFAYLWSSSENGSNAWSRDLVFNDPQVGRYSNDKNYGVSVRCLKN